MYEPCHVVFCNFSERHYLIGEEFLLTPMNHGHKHSYSIAPIEACKGGCFMSKVLVGFYSCAARHHKNSPSI
jgi:hypothetical protein